MNFTSREQSKVLVGLGLEPSTCDFCYEEKAEKPIPFENELPKGATPCWSCERLLELLPMEIKLGGNVWKFSILTQNEDKMYVLTYSFGGNTFSKNSESLFCAAYDMLHDFLIYF